MAGTNGTNLDHEQRARNDLLYTDQSKPGYLEPVPHGEDATTSGGANPDVNPRSDEVNARLERLNQLVQQSQTSAFFTQFAKSELIELLASYRAEANSDIRVLVLTELERYLTGCLRENPTDKPLDKMVQGLNLQRLMALELSAQSGTVERLSCGDDALMYPQKNSARIVNRNELITEWPLVGLITSGGTFLPGEMVGCTNNGIVQDGINVASIGSIMLRYGAQNGETRFLLDVEKHREEPFPPKHDVIPIRELGLNLTRLHEAKNFLSPSEVDFR